MTDEEAQVLKPGNRVLGIHKGDLAIMEITGGRGYHPENHWGYLRVRKLGRTSAGAPYPSYPLNRFKLKLWRLPAPDALAAGVYADWLDEAGFPEAALALRRAFPIDPGKAEGD